MSSKKNPQLLFCLLLVLLLFILLFIITYCLLLYLLYYIIINSYNNTNAKLLACKTCLPHLEQYAEAACVSHSRKDIISVIIRHRTTLRSSSTIYNWYQQGVRWCRRCQDQVRTFSTTQKGRDQQQLTLFFMHILLLAKEEHHSSLSESYNEITNQPIKTMATRLQKCGISTTFRTNSIQYHNSFLPRTIHDLKKGQSGQTVSYSANTGLTLLLTPYRQAIQNLYRRIQTRLNK